MKRLMPTLWLVIFYVSSAVAVGDDAIYTLNGVRVGQQEDRTRVVLDLSGPVAFQVRGSSISPGIIFEMANTTVTTPIAELSLSNTPIASIDTSSERDNTLLLTIHLVADNVVHKYFFLQPNGEKGHRLVVDLYPRSPDSRHEAAVAQSSSSNRRDAVTSVAPDVHSLTNIRLGQLNNKTRLVFDLSGPADYRVLKLNDPLRILVEIEKTVANSVSGSSLPLTDTPIGSVRIPPDTDHESSLQIEIGLATEVEYKYFFLKPKGQKNHRLVVDLSPLNAGWLDHAVDTQSVPSQVPQSAAAQNSRLRFSGIWEQEWAVETDGVDSQKFEALIEPRLDMEISQGLSLTAIARIRLDAVGDLGPGESRPDNYSSFNGPLYNDEHAELSLRELYLDAQWGAGYWRLGKQQVVWGQADGIKVLDVINPQSFREFILDDFDDSRIPLTMANVQMPLGDQATLQLLWIFDTTYHELAETGTPYFLTSPLLVPVAPEGLEVIIQDPDVPDDLLGDSDFGGRLSGFVGGWDVTLNYLYHYQDYPVYYQNLHIYPDGAWGVVSPEYERNHMAGGTLSNAFGDVTLRAEMAYSTDTFHVSSDIRNRGIANSAELASVIGIDWQLGEYDTLLSLQWFQSHLFDHQASINRDENEQNVSLYYQRDFANETWQFDTLMLYSLNNEDSMIQLKLKYLWRSNLELWLGADIFSGNREGIYGQFKELDRLLIGMKLGF